MEIKTELPISIVFGVDANKARPDYCTMRLQQDGTINGWGGQKRGVEVRGKRYIVEVFLILDGQTEMELK